MEVAVEVLRGCEARAESEATAAELRRGDRGSQTDRRHHNDAKHGPPRDEPDRRP
jgi:hypothetical protein